MEYIENILECISDLYKISNEINIKLYIWGGYVQDIIEGKILRKHGDIDMFMENMEENIEQIQTKLDINNFQHKYNSEIEMLNLEKNNVRITINPIKFIQETAIWKHIGKYGFVNFPKNWLDKDYKQFYNVKILTSGFRFEYCIRNLLKYMNPEWNKNKREKDIRALEYYETKLLENNIEPNELMNKIWAYNQFWLKDGYNGYEAPVLVIGKDYINNPNCTYLEN